MKTQPTMQPFYCQIIDLFLIQLTNWRWSWRLVLVQGTIAPVVLILAYAAFAPPDDHIALGYILTGNMMFSLFLGNVDRIAINFGYMRMTGMLGFFASMPIYRPALVLSSATAFFLLNIPSLFAVLLIGSALVDVPIQVSPLILLIAPLVSYALCGLGAVIGTLRISLDQIGSITVLLAIVMLFLGPVMIPPDRLHPAFKAVGYFSPATYAASALRHVTLDIPQEIPLWVDVIVLLGLAVGLLWWGTRRMDWREG